MSDDPQKKLTPDFQRGSNEAAKTASREALRLISERKPRMALQILERCITDKTADAIVFAQAGRLYLDLNELDLAETYLLKSQRLQPNDPRTLQALGDIYFKRNEPYAALAYYQKALGIKQEKPEIIMGKIAEVYLDLSDLEEAKKWIDEQLSINPKNRYALGLQKKYEQLKADSNSPEPPHQ